MATRILLPLFLLTLLSACEQPAPEQAAETTATPEASSGADSEKLASIDADGNIAPFGFASKQPVPVEAPADVPAADAGQPASGGADIYAVNCVACHGADAQGVQGLGLNLVESEFVGSASTEELAAFLKVGRPSDAADNVTGVPMPSFGWMSADELADITGYLKSL